MKALAKAAEFSARLAWIWRDRRNRSRSPSTAIPQLLIDISTIVQHDAQTGIQRVVRAVMAELVRRDGQGFSVRPVYATPTRGFCYVGSDEGDERGGEAVRVATGDRFLGLDLTTQIIPKYQEQIRDWRRQGVTVHMVVYDLLPILHPDWFVPAASRNHRRWLRFIVKNADQAICISKSVADDLKAVLATMRTDRRIEIAELRMGGDIEASVPTVGISAEVREALERMEQSRSVLMVGTVEPRKGYSAALHAFEHLWNNHPGDAPDLIIVGKRGWKTHGLQEILRNHPEQGRRLRWLETVSDEALCALYDRAAGVLVASHGEGFGLPLLEAAARGRPILARDLPVFRQQDVTGANFFGDDDPIGLGAKILELVHRPQPAARVKQLRTWRSSVDMLLQDLGLNSERPARNMAPQT